MDLNHLYAQHQLSVMRADHAIGRLARTKYLAAADLFANRIGDYQRAKGAAASAAWLGRSEHREPKAARSPGLFR